jgi:hypothetical protein
MSTAESGLMPNPQSVTTAEAAPATAAQPPKTRNTCNFFSKVLIGDLRRLYLDALGRCEQIHSSRSAMRPDRDDSRSMRSNAICSEIRPSMKMITAVVSKNTDIFVKRCEVT